MNRIVIALVASTAFAGATVAQVSLYSESFPYPGPSGSFPVSACGWSNAVPNNPNRLYQVAGTNGAVYAYQASGDVPITTAFFTTAALDGGATGMAFPGFNPASFGGLAFSVDIQPYYTPNNITARFAVQMNGTNWYAAATGLPVPGTVGGFATYTQTFNPAAAAWNGLTISATNATIGSVATINLTGLITGAGLVFTHLTNGGTYNFDNFQINAAIGTPTVSSISNRAINLSWPAAANVSLQCTTNLATAAWLGVSNTLGQNTATMPTSGRQMFFRLASLNGSGTALTQANLGFEANGAAVAVPAGWTTTGNTAASYVISNDAYAGSFSLQQSNATAYEVETSTLITNLPNGYYSLTAYVKNSGGQNACYLAGNDKLTSLPPINTNWMETIVRGISVTNGQCLIRIHSDANASNWCRIDALTLTNDNISYDFLKGGDISELTYVEQGGGRFYETNGAQEDCLQLLKNHGCNFVRIRLYNDPGNAGWYPASLLPAGIQSLTNVLSLAARAKAMGFKIELTLTYSDYWADGETQYKPHGWESLSLAGLTNALYSFTTNVMMQMAGQGTVPDYVSLGNQIDAGILLQNSTPTGSTPQTTNATVNGSTANMSNLAQLLNAGYAAVKVISPATQVIIHTSHVDASGVTYLFNKCQNAGVKWDVMGCSYYPFWSGLTAEQARDQINSWYANYNKPVIIMETGYNWSTNLCDGSTGQLASNAPEPFPSTPSGQKQFLLDLFNDLKLVSNGNCLGDLYWDPVFICVPGEGWELGQPNVVDNTTLFDFAGNALPVLDALFYNN